MEMIEARWRIGPGELKTLRGMIIDRDKAWRADAEMAPVIDAAITAGLKNVDEPTFNRIYMFLRYGPFNEATGQRESLPGTYETRGLDTDQMKAAWKKYRKRTAD